MTVITCIFLSCCNCFYAFFSGGSTFTIRGEGFNNVGNITVEKVVSRISTRGNEDNVKCIETTKTTKLRAMSVKNKKANRI